MMQQTIKTGEVEEDFTRIVEHSSEMLSNIYFASSIRYETQQFDGFWISLLSIQPTVQLSNRLLIRLMLSFTSFYPTYSLLHN